MTIMEYDGPSRDEGRNRRPFGHEGPDSYNLSLSPSPLLQGHPTYHGVLRSLMDLSPNTFGVPVSSQSAGEWTQLGG